MADGTSYKDKDKYLEQMLQKSTFGTTCELIAAGKLYPICIELYKFTQMIAMFGDASRAHWRLLFSGSLNRGHFSNLIEKEWIKMNMLPPTSSFEKLSLIVDSKYSYEYFNNYIKIYMHGFYKRLQLPVVIEERI